MRKIAGALTSLCLFAAAPASATNGMRMIGSGPVQESMGGVGVGATLDTAALVSNPAGIVELGQRLDVAAGYFKPTVSYRATGAATGMVASDGKTFDSRRGASLIPAIGYVHPLTERLSAGVGVFGVSGMGVNYRTNLYYGPTVTSYMQARLTPGVAYRLGETLAIGVTANLMLAQMKYDVAAGAGQQEHDTATAYGLGATVGVKYTPSGVLSIGAAYESRSHFQDFRFDIPEHTASGTTFPAGTDKLAFDQPQSATLGLAVTPAGWLLVAADVQWINWSDTMGKKLPKFTSDPNATGAMPFDMRWGDQWVLKLGAQVSPRPGLRLRAGYNYGKMPLDSNRAFENIAFPAVSEHHVTAGVGYDATDRLALNVAGVYAFNARIQGANVAAQGIQSYRTEMSQLEITAGASYRF